jgi:Tol biopolymer transport system component
MGSLIAPPGSPGSAGAGTAQALFMEARRRRRRRWLAGTAAVLVAAAAVAVSAVTWLPGTASAPSFRSSAPAVPSWAKDLQGEVAYKCGDAICLMRLDGTGKRLLPGGGPLPYPQWDPAWSPDGRRLAFRGYYGSTLGDFAIYVVDANGCHLTKLSEAMNGTNPSWSPSGRQIAFAVGGINVINANGTGFGRLTSDQARSGRDRHDDEDPAWSLRNRIAFVRTRMRTSRGEIYVMNADGSGLSPLTHGGPGFGQPSWSADGKSIAFVAYPSSPARLYSAGVVDVANADGLGVHRVSPPSWWSYSPTWTPGGKIVFLVNRGFQATRLGNLVRASAYIVNRDGTGLRLLYPNLDDAGEIASGSVPLPNAGC